LRPRTEPGFPPGAFTGWRATIAPGRLLLGVYLPLTRDGEEHVPGGPFVVAANHYSHLDPVIVSLAIGRRPVRYLAVDELYGNSRFFDALTLWLGAIPMSRTRTPLRALRLALEELAAGGVVGLFPEGVRVWTWGEVPPKRGAAWLAARAGVPLLPVAIHGSGEAMGRGTARISRRPVHASVLEPILPADFPDTKERPAEMTRVWWQRIDAALAER
jgi:1-acyl-sn-glycerol-3-phosphate acyltransferase